MPKIAAHLKHNNAKGPFDNLARVSPNPSSQSRCPCGMQHVLHEPSLRECSRRADRASSVAPRAAVGCDIESVVR